MTRLAGVDAGGELRLVVEVIGPDADARARALLTAYPQIVAVEDGETFETHRVVDGVLTPKPPAAPPMTITMLQLRLALALPQFDLLDAVNAWVATQPADRRIAWEYATTVTRADPWIEDARVALQLSPAAGDALFAAAAQLAR